MSEPVQNESSDLARRRLRKASRTKDISVRMAWAITIGEALLLGLVGVALMDYWLMLPVWMRSAAAGVLALVALVGAVRLVRFLRRPTTFKEAALDVEAATPTLGCEISTAAEYLSGERNATHEYEPELVAALESKAAAGLETVEIPYRRRLLIPVVALGVTMAGVLLFLLVAPGTFTAFKRAAFPLSNASYTQVQVTPGNIEIPAGTDLEITNLFSGRTATDPEIHWQRPGDSTWQKAPLLTRSSEGEYLYTLPELRGTVRYRVTGGDAVSPDFEIRTYVPPEVKDLDVRVHYPGYTGLAETNQSSPNITAVRASAADIQIKPSVPLSKASLRFTAGKEPIALQPRPDGTWTTRLTLTNDTDYWIELADEKGRAGTQEEPHRIRAVPDAPPAVVIEQPGQDMRAAATNSLPLEILVTDDFGVDQVELVVHKLNGPEQIVPARLEQGQDGKVLAKADLDLTTLGLKEFELVAYYARAKDNNSLDGPGVGKSPTYFVEITDLAQGQPKPQVPGTKVNLLAVQKQLIADTVALETNTESQVFGDLATRQRDAADFGQIYLKAIAGSGLAGDAVREMQSALSEMTQAAAHLDAQKPGEALPSEEKALAHLYQVLKLRPELEDLPLQPKPQEKPPQEKILAVVLEAIRERENAPTEDQLIQDALQQAERLAQNQSTLNAALTNAAKALAERPGNGQADARQQAQSGTQNPSEEPPAANGQGQDQGNAQASGQAQGRGAQGQQKGQGKGEPGGDRDQEQSSPPSEKPKEARMAKLSPKDTASQANGQNRGKGKNASPAKPKNRSINQDASQTDGKGSAPGKGANKGKAQVTNSKDVKAGGQAQGKGEPQPPGNDPLQSEPQPQQNAQENATSPNSEQLAAQEDQLSEETAELARKLDRLAGKDTRVGHKAGQNAKLAGQKIATASQEIKKGRFGAAGVHGFEGELALREVVSVLKRIAPERPDLTDAASEEAPKQYEPLISEYFKKLSHAE